MTLEDVLVTFTSSTSAPAHMYQEPKAKRLSLNQYSCHGGRFMLLFAHSYAVHLTARTYYLGEM